MRLHRSAGVLTRAGRLASQGDDEYKAMPGDAGEARGPFTPPRASGGRASEKTPLVESRRDPITPVHPGVGAGAGAGAGVATGESQV